MSLRDEARYRRALLRNEAPKYERWSQELEKDGKMLREAVERLHQWKETRGKSPSSEDPIKASNAKFIDVGIALVLAGFDQMLAANHIATEVVEKFMEALRTWESVSLEEATEEELHQAAADVTKITTIARSKKCVLDGISKVFKDAHKLLMDASPNRDI